MRRRKTRRGAAAELAAMQLAVWLAAAGQPLVLEGLGQGLAAAAGSLRLQRRWRRRWELWRWRR
jgi:hypothetical protein